MANCFEITKLVSCREKCFFYGCTCLHTPQLQSINHFSKLKKGAIFCLIFVQRKKEKTLFPLLSMSSSTTGSFLEWPLLTPTGFVGLGFFFKLTGSLKVILATHWISCALPKFVWIRSGDSHFLLSLKIFLAISDLFGLMSVKAPRAHLYWPSEFLLCSYYRVRLTFVRSPLNNSPPRRQFKPNVHDPPCDPGKKINYLGIGVKISRSVFLYLFCYFLFLLLSVETLLASEIIFIPLTGCAGLAMPSPNIYAAPPCKLPTLALDVVKICALHQRPLARQLDQKVTLTALASHPY